MVFEVRSLVQYETVCSLLLFVFAVVTFPYGGAVRSWVWLGCGFQSFCRGRFYRIAWTFCFWKALLSLMNFARVSMPFLVT